MFNKAILIIGLVLIGTSLGVSSVEAERFENERQQWRYECKEAGSIRLIERTANQAGEMGWEMVNFTVRSESKAGGERYGVCFKQPIGDQKLAMISGVDLSERIYELEEEVDGLKSKLIAAETGSDS